MKKQGSLMSYKRLGKSGLKVSILGLGTWINSVNKMSQEEFN
jgi:aryl-alcohol dehydrogenase-like predicted oxidoreductase